VCPVIEAYELSSHHWPLPRLDCTAESERLPSMFQYAMSASTLDSSIAETHWIIWPGTEVW
jgi:hypothetical protein